MFGEISGQDRPGDAQARSSPRDGVTSLPPNPEHVIAPGIAVLGTYVLPMMFGYIGTFTSAFRTVQDRMRDYTLGPQDFVMVMMSVPTGVIAGVAVGLFYPVPGAAPGANAFTTDLTAGGVAFLAGYAAEAFFKVLDSLPERAFRAGPPTPPATR